MKKTNRGCWWSVLSVALFFAMAFLLSACDFSLFGGGGEKLSMLHAEGENVVDEAGDPVYLRGVNAGGLFVTENWMNGFEQSTSEEIPIRARDFRSLTEVFLRRFGKERTLSLWDEYRRNWWSDEDFNRCEALGMNVIRLPFTYMTVDFDAIESYDNAGKNYDFSALDAFVEEASKRGIYTILDLHGAYGSQNGQDHSGQTIDSADDVGFYSDERMIELTAKLWGALAAHYKDNPAVAGYDLLNEPGEKAALTEERHFKVFDILYRAVREQDESHIVIFESCWDGKDLPHPSLYGWENCMYSFHHYTNCSQGGQYLEHGTSWNQKIEGVAAQNFGVPLYMGEFTCYNDAEQWEYCLDLLNALGWHWTSWTYKINNTWNNSAWGVFSVPATGKVNAHTDGYETILEKFSALRTTEDIHATDLGGTLLKDIVQTACAAPAEGKRTEQTFEISDTLTGNALYTDGQRVYCIEDGNAFTPFTVTPHPSGDGSVFIRYGSAYLAVEESAVAVRRADGSAGNDCRFYLFPTEYGYVLYSYQTCRAVTVDAQGRLRADGARSDGAIFDLRLLQAQA